MELKPCPFCGCKYIDFSGGDRWAMCTSCLSEGPVHLTKEKAAIAWNTRYTEPMNTRDTDLLLEEMVEVLEYIYALANPKGVNEWVRAAKVLKKYYELVGK